MSSSSRQFWNVVFISAVTSAIVSGAILSIGRLVVAEDDRVEFLGLVLALAAFFVGLFQYRCAIKQRRAEWLDQLSQRFYEQAKYKGIRRTLDYEEQPGLANLKGAVLEATSHESRTLMEDLVDYLNFFEHLGVLEKMGQLTASEIEDMFGYYLGLIRRHEFLRSYVNQRGESFEQLARLLQKPRNRTTPTT